MARARKHLAVSDVRAEYDFRGGVRGRYSRRFERGVRIVTLDKDVAAYFPDSASVNDALRVLVALAGRRANAARRRRASSRPAHDA